jgi:hypothetical protein
MGRKRSFLFSSSAGGEDTRKRRMDPSINKGAAPFQENTEGQWELFADW